MPVSAALLRHLLLLLCLLPTLGATAAESDAPGEPVRAVVFVAPSCTECEEIFDYLLPALFDHYAGRLEVAAIDTGAEGGAAVYAAAEGQGLVPAWSGAPVALVAGRSAEGLDAIAARLGDDFDALAADPAAHSWPTLPGLAELLPEGLARVHERVAAAPVPNLPAATADDSADRDRIANILAIVVLVGMCLALIHSLVRVRRPARTTAGNTALIPLILIIGLLISAYTAYTSITGATAVCGPIGSCNAVQQSEYAKIFGIPMGVIGVFGYVAIIVTWLFGRGAAPAGGSWRWIPWGLALFATLFSIRLTYLEPFVIGHTCLWCLGSAVTSTLSLWLLSGETRA